MPVAFLEGPDLIIVLVIVVVLFGASKLPGLARSLGEAQREFHNATRGDSPGTPAGEETVTMTRAELDRLVAERASHPETPAAGSSPGSAKPPPSPR